jgi:predicted site-specific integrase-resolvase
MLRSLDGLLTKETVAEKLGVSLRTIERYTLIGVRGVKLQATPVGHRMIRYAESDVLLFIELTRPREMATAS